MKYLCFLLPVFLLIGCKTQKENTTHSTLRRNQLEGTVLEVVKRISRKSQETVSEYFLKLNAENYYIKFNEGYVTKLEIKKHLKQKIIIKGEIKTGKWEKDKPGSISKGTPPKKARVGKYIVIYKIYD
ncbi:MAG: hypothetical protein HRT73_15355 [Flavobacteriales bacterium]|nr:hypothetical protein [Flavobacteriales bacterium]